METILTRVLEHARTSPDRLCVHAISKRKGEAKRTFGEVARDAGVAAGFLAARGVKKGDIVVLIGTHHIDLYAAWLGTVWLGAVPTILAEPSVRINQRIYWSRLEALLERIGARVLLTDPAIQVKDEGWPKTLTHFAYDALLKDGHEAPRVVEPAPSDLLLLQHSSGTTGLQKGVMLSHGAIMRHGDAYQRALALSSDDVVASWLPLYHDMGMIGCFVMPLLYGVPVLWLSPFEWVANPMLLIEAASQHKATLMWLPNFAYLFLAQRAKHTPGTYDLSSLRAVIDCSEPVTEVAMNTFAERFGADGFSRSALHASYAMAENIFAVTQSTPEQPPRSLEIDAERWREEHRAVPVDGPSGRASVKLVSSGVAVPSCEVKIADDRGAALPAYHAGRVLIRSTFLFDGYFEDPRRDLFDADGFYDTGDLGLVDPEGHVYVTGRKKDLVIVGGKNVYPQDVEHVVNDVEGVHPGRVVCFGVGVRDLGTEGLVVLVESELPSEAWPDLARRIQRAVPAALDVDLTDARVVPRQELRKSTSGKLARGGNREWYLAGKFGPVADKIADKVGDARGT